MSYFTSASDAASTLMKVLRSDYFQDFSEEDRILDPDGIYAMSAEITVQGDGEEMFYFTAKEREALALFAEATPDERADLFETWG